MSKLLKPKLLLIPLMAMIHLDGHGGGGNGFRVLPPDTLGESIDPAEPGAYENFTLILSVGYPFSDGTESVDLEVFDGTIRVEVPTGSGFTGGSTLGTDVQGLPAGEYTVKFFRMGMSTPPPLALPLLTLLLCSLLIPFTIPGSTITS